MISVATLADLPQLEPRIVTVEGERVGIIRIRDEVFAFSPTCTHRNAPMIEGAVTWKGTILCPWHLGTFKLRDGAVLSGPPERALPCYSVRIEGGDVLVERPALG